MSKIKIENLGDLSDFLQSLKVKQLSAPIKVLPISHEGREICEVEVTEEPFLENKKDRDEFGYTSELKRKLGSDFNELDYHIIEPAGTVIFYAK